MRQREQATKSLCTLCVCNELCFAAESKLKTWAFFWADAIQQTGNTSAHPAQRNVLSSFACVELLQHLPSEFYHILTSLLLFSSCSVYRHKTTSNKDAGVAREAGWRRARVGVGVEWGNSSARNTVFPLLPTGTFYDLWHHFGKILNTERICSSYALEKRRYVYC